MNLFDYDATQGHDPEPETCEHCGEVMEDGVCPNPHTLWAGWAVDPGDICLHDLHGHKYLAVHYAAGWRLQDEKGMISPAKACALIVEMWVDGPWKDDAA